VLHQHNCNKVNLRHGSLSITYRKSICWPGTPYLPRDWMRACVLEARLIEKLNQKGLSEITYLLHHNHPVFASASDMIERSGI
jgi:hypothetical protein